VVVSKDNDEREGTTKRGATTTGNRGDNNERGNNNARGNDNKRGHEDKRGHNTTMDTKTQETLVSWVFIFLFSGPGDMRLPDLFFFISFFRFSGHPTPTSPCS
jgi:hypothetical protein